MSTLEAIGQAMAAWDSAPVGSFRLDFVEAAVTSVPTLRFMAKSGCGVVELSADEATFATSTCRSGRHVAREIGVALGLPRVHQRPDRDLHLRLADASAFSCERGEFFDICPSYGELVAEFGPFSRSGLMYASGVTRHPDQACELAPDGPHLYLPHDLFVLDCSEVEVESPILALDGDRNALAELYASTRGWLPLRELTAVTDVGVPAPFPGLLRSPPTLVPASNGNVFLFAWGVAAEHLDLFVTVHDGASWAEWKLALPAPEQPPPPVDFYEHERVLAVERAPGTFDIVAHIGATPAHITYGASGAAWTVPSDSFATASALVAYSGGLALYRASGDRYLRVRGSQGTSWSEWEPFLEVPPDAIGAQLAAVGAGGVQHLALVPSHGAVYYRQADSPRWVFLSDLLGSPSTATVKDVAITETPGGRLDIFALTTESALYQLTCEPPRNCLSPMSWSAPAFLFGDASWALASLSAAASNDAIDVVVMTARSGGTLPYLLGHKRWRRVDD